MKKSGAVLLTLVWLGIAGVVLSARLSPLAMAAVDETVTDSPIFVADRDANYDVDYGKALTIPVTISADRDEYVKILPMSRGITTPLSIVRVDGAADEPQTVELTLNADKALEAGKHQLSVAFAPLDGELGRELQIDLRVAKVTLTVTSVEPVTKGFGETVDPYSVQAETTEGPKTLGELGLTAPSFAEDCRVGTYHDRLNPSRSPNYEVEGAPKLDVTVEPAEPKVIGIRGSELREGAMARASAITGIALNPYTDEIVYGSFAWEDPDATMTEDDIAADAVAVAYRFTPIDTTDYLDATGTVDVPIAG